MKKIITIILTLIINSIGVAQNFNNVWIFGDSAGIDFSTINNPMPIVSGMDGRGSCTSICDSNGNLMIYAATLSFLNTDWNTRIFNAQNQILQGCDSITGEAWYNELLTIPRPNHSSQYYVFSIGLDQPNNQGCFYTLIDMSLNSGQGGVLSQNIRRNSANSADCLAAVKHGNGRDWWVINKYSSQSATSQNRFYVYLVKPTGVSAAIVQNFNNATDGDIQRIILNSANNRFMVINPAGYMSEFDFDRCTGAITLNRNIFPEQTGNYDRFFWDGAYSPNDSVFYVSTFRWTNLPNQYLLQYNLSSANIPGSCDTLDVYQVPIGTGSLRLAPDGKIYFSRAYECNAFPYCYPYPDSARNYVNENLSVINYPDSLGAACGYAPFSFYLGGKRTYYGLPNNPNYNLGPLTGSLCDTLTVITEINPNEKSPLVNLAPNPVVRTLYFNAERVKGKNARVMIRNALGEVVYEKTAEVFYGGYVTQPINVSGFNRGVYFITLQTEKENVTEKFLKQ